MNLLWLKLFPSFWTMRDLVIRRFRRWWRLNFEGLPWKIFWRRNRITRKYGCSSQEQKIFDLLIGNYFSKETLRKSFTLFKFQYFNNWKKFPSLAKNPMCGGRSEVGRFESILTSFNDKVDIEPRMWSISKQLFCYHHYWVHCSFCTHIICFYQFRPHIDIRGKWKKQNKR